MRDLKTYLSVALVVTLWFGTLAGLLIEINCFFFFPDALNFPFFSF